MRWAPPCDCVEKKSAHRDRSATGVRCWWPRRRNASKRASLRRKVMYTPSHPSCAALSRRGDLRDQLEERAHDDERCEVPDRQQEDVNSQSLATPSSDDVAIELHVDERCRPGHLPWMRRLVTTVVLTRSIADWPGHDARGQPCIPCQHDPCFGRACPHPSSERSRPCPRAGRCGGARNQGRAPLARRAGGGHAEAGWDRAR